MTTSPRRRRQQTSSEKLPTRVFLVIAPIGILLCLANVFIIFAHVETSSVEISNDAIIIMSPDSATRRIGVTSLMMTAPPIIHGGVKLQQFNKTNNNAAAAVVDAGEDDIDKGYGHSDDGEEDKEAQEQEKQEDNSEDDDGDVYWMGDDEEGPRDPSLDEPTDKEPILQILREAGIDDIDNETMARLPTWSDVTRLYGSAPKVYGLETCAAFRNHSEKAEHFIGVAGNFNSGTNLLSELLIHNCLMTDRMAKYGPVNKGVRWQVPWGKHSPPLNEEFRRTHKTKPGDKNIEAHNVMPIVTIRDPYVWMQSMCRHPYGAYWPNDTGHNPNLVPDERDFAKEPWLKYKQSVPIDVQYNADAGNREHDSLVHFWNEWYSEYLQATFPRVIVRFEDLIFHAKQVTTQVCTCAGGRMTPKFTYITKSAKKGTPGAHGEDRTSFIDAIIRYGTDTARLEGFTLADIEFARSHLNLKLMDLFGYQFDDPPQAVASIDTDSS